MSAVEIKTVESKKDLLNFIKLQWKIYANDPNWVPPLIMDRKKLLNKKNNPFYQHAEMELFLAFKNNEIVGRIAAITNENHNKFHEDKAGFFGFFESIEDAEVTKKLLDTAKEWLKQKGKDSMLGPINPSTNDEVGLLIDGFDSPPYLLMNHNHRYYQILLENYGLVKAKDLYAWFLDIRKNEIPEKMIRVAEKSAKKYGIKIRNMSLKNLKEELKIVSQVYNDAWSKNWGFVPMTKEEFVYVADDLKPIADEDFLLIVEKDGKPIGFGLTLPNINEILIKIPNGKLFPTGIFKLLSGKKKIKTVRVIILGIIKEFQHGGVGSIMYIDTIRRAQERGLIGGEMSWILEDNHTMNRAIESLGSEKHKTYRIYEQKF